MKTKVETESNYKCLEGIKFNYYFVDACGNSECFCFLRQLDEKKTIFLVINKELKTTFGNLNFLNWSCF